MEDAIVNGYRVERVLSTRLGIHTVMEAVDPDGHHVALTLLDAAVTEDPRLRRHVLRLARTRASIDHPNVLPLLGTHELENRVGLVSVLAGPRTLADRLETGPLEPDEALRILCQVAGALETAAAHGLVHRDLAPKSIVLADGEPDRVFLGDFGITMPPLPGCELVDAAEGIDYSSPEEVRGEPLEPESNVYSLACILVECLTGAPPFPYDRPLLTLHAHVVETPPSVSERRPGLPAALDEVIARAMAKDQRERFRSPGRLMRAVGEALGLEVTAPVLVPPRVEGLAPARPRRRPRPRPRLLGGRLRLALTAVALCGFVAGVVDWSAPPASSGADRVPAAAERAQRAEHIEAVGDAVRRLDARRVALRRELRRARRPAGQAAAARALAAAYGDTREALPGPAVAIPGAGRIAERLRETERAYRRLASAARSRDRRAWRVARRATVRREAGLERALR
jgi:Protein kinase domain